mmetsp:Transcript_29963/g.55080  ORF Transcript_29963/g.55080 Transcript_29963/m.55080 type:complete len:95 (-) Transcript_29963:1316-1600(-)
MQFTGQMIDSNLYSCSSESLRVVTHEPLAKGEIMTQQGLKSAIAIIKDANKEIKVITAVACGVILLRFIPPRRAILPLSYRKAGIFQNFGDHFS